MEFHVHKFQVFITLFLTTPIAVVLSVFIDVGGCLCTISLSQCFSGMDSLQFIYRYPSLASAAEEITTFMICATLRMAPLFGGSGESPEMKKWPTALILAFVSDRQEASFYTDRIVTMAR